jgi:PEP-CTERM motif
MKRAMGLALMVLGFAVAAHADRVTSDGLEGRTGEVLVVHAAPTEALGTAILVDEAGMFQRDWSSNFGALDNSGRLTANIFDPRFDGSTTTARGSADSNFVQEWLDGILGTRDEGRGSRFGINHPEPFHRFLGVQDVPESGTLLLMGMGLALIAVRMRRSAA